jgi:7,8-dihydroneopterin aldolase/epimerase/oxygenase
LLKLGWIALENLPVPTEVGVYACERGHTTDLVLDLYLQLDFAPAAASDALADTLDYDAVVAFFSARQPQLLEALLLPFADALLAEFSSVRRLRLRLHKPLANGLKPYLSYARARSS